MTDQSMSKSTLEELERLVQDEEFWQLYPARNQAAAAIVNEGASSTGTTPNDPLNTAFINETTVHEQHSPISLSQPQSQTTKETSSTIHGLIDTILEQEDEILDLGLPTRIRLSMGTMSKTPTKISTGTMPKTPTMKSTGTMPKTPTMISTGTMPRTPTMASTGTMPKTPTMASTAGTMPRTPTMASTATMPKTPTTIDLVSPTIETIDLCSPDKTSNPGSSHSPPHLAPQ